MTTEVVPVRYRDFELLHPVAKRAFVGLATTLQADYEAGRTPHLFVAFETYRTPQHQLLALKRKASQAGSFWSAHQYGLAVDFVPFLKGRGFYWDATAEEWNWLRHRAAQAGLDNTIPWDRAHVQHPLWNQLRDVMIAANDNVVRAGRAE